MSENQCGSVMDPDDVVYLNPRCELTVGHEPPHISSTYGASWGGGRHA